MAEVERLSINAPPLADWLGGMRKRGGPIATMREVERTIVALVEGAEHQTANLLRAVPIPLEVREAFEAETNAGLGAGEVLYGMEKCAITAEACDETGAALRRYTDLLRRRADALDRWLEHWLRAIRPNP